MTASAGTPTSTKQLILELQVLFKKAAEPIWIREQWRSDYMPWAQLVFSIYTLVIIVWRLAIFQSESNGDNQPLLIAGIVISFFCYVMLIKLFYEKPPFIEEHHRSGNNTKNWKLWTELVQARYSITLQWSKMAAFFVGTAFGLLRLAVSFNQTSSYFNDSLLSHLIDIPFLAWVSFSAFLGDTSFNSGAAAINLIALYHATPTLTSADSHDAFIACQSLLFVATVFYDPVNRLKQNIHTKFRKGSWGYTYQKYVPWWLFYAFEVALLSTLVVLRAVLFSFGDFSILNGVFLAAGCFQVYLVWVDIAEQAVKHENREARIINSEDSRMDEIYPDGFISPRFMLCKLHSLVEACDHNLDGYLDFVEFVSLCSVLSAEANCPVRWKSYKVEALESAYKIFNEFFRTQPHVHWFDDFFYGVDPGELLKTRRRSTLPGTIVETSLNAKF